MLSDCGFDLEWNNCYGTNKKYWAKSAFEHPAKASPDLCNRIIDHLEELGILTENSVVIDPMSGIGTSLLTAAVRGYKTIGVELEPKFVDLINKNISFVKEKEYLYYTPIIIQGDARKLSELLTERNLILITSPSYGLGKGTGHSEGGVENSLRDIKTSKKLYQYCGETDRNIGNMSNNVVLTSPPYSGQNQRDALQEQYGAQVVGGLKRNIRQTQPYSTDSNNIGNLRDNVVITSPPYVGSDTTRVRGRKGDIERMIKKGIKVNPDSNSQTTKELYYGTSPDQIGNLKDADMVTIISPPYLDSSSGKQGGGIDWGKRKRLFHPSDLHGLPKDYGAAEGQIGNLPNVNTYQGAMLKVYQEMYKCCSSAAIITKNPTKKKQIYPLDKLTIGLLELAGWKVKCVHHAILCWEELEDDKTVLKGRVGFFKRLQWQKGQPIAMHEDIIIVTK